MNETEKMFDLTQKTYELVEGIFGSYNNLNKLYENSINEYEEQNNLLKEALENAQKNLAETQKLKEENTQETNKIEAILKDQSLITQSVGQIQKSIDDFNAQTAINEKDMNDAKAEIFVKKKETIDFINKKLEEIQDQKNQISKLLQSVPKDDSVTIEGAEATVVHNGDIVHYKFPTGTNLENIDFIDEKADNGVDTLLGELEELSMLSMKNGFSLMDTIKSENKIRNLYISSSDGLKIGESLGLKNEKGEDETLEAFLMLGDGHLTLENGDSKASLSPQGLNLKHQTSELILSKGGLNVTTDEITSVINLEAKNTATDEKSSLTINPAQIEFYCDNGLYLNSKNDQGEVERKKILLEGDVNTANSNQKFFLEEGESLEGHMPYSSFSESDSVDTDSEYYQTNKIDPITNLNKYGYPYLGDKENYCFLSPEKWKMKSRSSEFFIDFTNPLLEIGANGAIKGDDQIIVRHSITMGYPDQPLMLSCNVNNDAYSVSGISIQYQKINTNGIGIEDQGTFIYSQEGYPPDYDTSNSPYPVDRSSINISPKQIDIQSKSFTFNGREVLFK